MSDGSTFSEELKQAIREFIAQKEPTERGWKL